MSRSIAALKIHGEDALLKAVTSDVLLPLGEQNFCIDGKMLVFVTLPEEINSSHIVDMQVQVRAYTKWLRVHDNQSTVRIVTFTPEEVKDLIDSIQQNDL